MLEQSGWWKYQSRASAAKDWQVEERKAAIVEMQEQKSRRVS